MSCRLGAGPITARIQAWGGEMDGGYRRYADSGVGGECFKLQNIASNQEWGVFFTVKSLLRLR